MMMRPGIVRQRSSKRLEIGMSFGKRDILEFYQKKRILIKKIS
jgi:hypothetical protein